MDVDHTMQEAEIQPQSDPGSTQDPQVQVLKSESQEERAGELTIGSEQPTGPRQEDVQKLDRLSREVHSRKHDEVDSSQAGPPEDDGIQEQDTIADNEPPPSGLVVAKIVRSLERMVGYGKAVTPLQCPEHEPERKRPRLQPTDDVQTRANTLKDNQGTGDATEEHKAAAAARSNDNAEDPRKSDCIDKRHSPSDGEGEEEESQDTAKDVSALQEAAHGMKIEEEQDQPEQSLTEPTESSSQPSNASQGSQSEPAQVTTEASQSQKHTPSTLSQSRLTSEGPLRPVVTTRGSRTRRDPVKKVPKVYPPRKPRVRPVSVEPLTMTIRTDSALSTLASAAVAIKNHQGPLSTLSVPPLSPTTQDAESPKVESASSPTPPEATAATSAPSRTTGRSPTKTPVPRDASGYRCELCPGERFGRVHDLKRHQISKHNEMTWPCDFCHRPFVRRDALLRHYSVKAARKDGVHPTEQEENRLKEAKARAKLLA
ncbi:hypothetical protein BGX34_006363 [Mortierella sp. NVP85]|nr:hypothetical protein BGX34_006363 [Mortierella sp. NVP85]